MKPLDKKATGIYVPGYQQVNNTKFASSQEEMIIDVLDTDEDRVMYQYNTTYSDKSRSQSKQYARNNRT